MNMGNEEQKAELLPRLVDGDARFALSITEPGGGTDVLGAMKTTASKVDGGWRINGAKVFTSASTDADHLVIVARTSPPGSKQRVRRERLPRRPRGTRRHAHAHARDERRGHERRVLRRRLRPRRPRARRRRPRLLRAARHAQQRAPRDRCDVRRVVAGGPRRGARVRVAARGVRRGDRPLPGGAAPHRAHARADGAGAPDGLQGRVAAVARPPVRARGHRGEAGRRREQLPGARHGDAGARRARVHARVRPQPLLAPGPAVPPRARCRTRWR